jgi:hypothetical protein
LLYAALIPHLFDVTERHKLLAGDFLASQAAALDFSSKPRDFHPSTRKCNSHGIRQSKGSCFRHLVVSFVRARHYATFLASDIAPAGAELRVGSIGLEFAPAYFANAPQGGCFQARHVSSYSKQKAAMRTDAPTRIPNLTEA